MECCVIPLEERSQKSLHFFPTSFPVPHRNLPSVSVMTVKRRRARCKMLHKESSFLLCQCVLLCLINLHLGVEFTHRLSVCQYITLHLSCPSCFFAIVLNDSLDSHHKSCGRFLGIVCELVDPRPAGQTRSTQRSKQSFKVRAYHTAASSSLSHRLEQHVVTEAHRVHTLSVNLYKSKSSGLQTTRLAVPVLYIKSLKAEQQTELNLKHAYSN